MKLFSSLLYGTRLPLRQRGASQKMDCTGVLLLVFVWDEAASGTARSNIGNELSSLLSVLLLAVPEAVLSHTKSEEHQVCRALLTEKTVCEMALSRIVVIAKA